MHPIDYASATRPGPPPERRYSYLALAAAISGAFATPLNCAALVILTPHNGSTPSPWHDRLWFADYLLFACLPGILAILAIISIRRNPHRLTGIPIALIGLFISTLLLLPVAIKLFN